MKKLIKPLVILAVIGAIIAVVASYGMGIYRVKEMNKKDSEIQLSVASGKVYARDTFDFEKVVALADEKMYETKRKMKDE